MLYTLQDTSVYKIPSFRTGRWGHTGREHSHCGHSKADVVLHHAGLARGRSAKRRTGSVPLGHLVPLWCVLSLQKDSSLPLHTSGAASPPIRCPPPSEREVKGVQGYCCCCFFPMPCTNEEVFCLPYLYG